MNDPSQEQIDGFINALQLSIMSRINSYDYEGRDKILSIYLDKFKNDTKLDLFEKIIRSQLTWMGSSKIVLAYIDSEQINILTNFLLLTRLEPEQIKFYHDSKQGNKFPFLKRLEGIGKTKTSIEVKDLVSASNYIFTKLSEKNMTLRELSELTGMTPASLHNFKNHQDIKLSTLIKMAKALGIVIRLE